MRMFLTALDGRALIGRADGTPHDFTSLRLALQAASAPMPCCFSALIPGAPNPLSVALFVGGLLYGYCVLLRTNTEATQMDAQHDAALAHAREVSRIEIKEREARLPTKTRPLRSVVAAPAPDGNEEANEHEISLAADVQFVYDTGVSAQSFARETFVRPNAGRLTLPSGEPLTRPKFSEIVERMKRDKILVTDPSNGSLMPSGGWQVGRRAMPDTAALTISTQIDKTGEK